MFAVKNRSLLAAFVILAFVAGAGVLVASAAASRSVRVALRGAAGLFVLDLERLGRTSEAVTELERGAEPSGIRDTAMLRELGLRTVALPATKRAP